MLFRKHLKWLSCLIFFLNTASSQSLTLLNVNISWTNHGNKTDFLVTSPLGNGISISNVWLGLGLNTNSVMLGASVVICTVDSGNSLIQHYYTQSFAAPPLLSSANPAIGISNGVVSTTGGILTCSYTRENSNSATNYYDLNANPQAYIITAYGTYSAGTISVHNQNTALASDTLSNLAVVGATTASTPSPSSTQAPSTGNGYFSSGVFSYSWSATGSSIKFTLSAQTSSSNNAWTAIGFSGDKQMGSDDVCACVYSTNLKDVVHYYNNGKSPQLQSSNNGVANKSVTIANGHITCSFDRLISLPSEANFFDLHNFYYLLAATGSTDDGGNIQYHSSKLASDQMVNFSANGSISSTSKFSYVRAHGKLLFNRTLKDYSVMVQIFVKGCLMIIAWLFCASTGIIIARHFKFMFPTRKICDLKIWFVIHRPLMFMVAVISIVAFIVILAYEEWSWLDTDDKVAFTHSIFGIVTIGLAILQIFFSFFRCKPDHKKRFIFNYFHRSLGIFTFICSVVAIFLGVNTNLMNLGNIGWELYIGWVIWLVILILILEILNITFMEPRKRSENYELTKSKKLHRPSFINASNKEKMNKIFETIKTVLLIIHLIISLAFTIAMLVFIGQATDSQVS